MRIKYSILFYVVTLTLSANAQFKVYQPFPHANARWSESTWCEEQCNGTLAGESKDFDYHITGDTLLHGKTYHKLNVSGGGEWFACAQENVYTAQQYDSLIGCFREDNKRIYYCDFKKKIYDTLLYDFNLKVGDILPDTYINSRNQHNRVNAIDSILIGKTYRKEYIIARDSLKHVEALIEGIGSTGGLLEPIRSHFEAGGRLNCFRQNGALIYPDANDSSILFNANATTLKVYVNSSSMLTVSYELPAGQHSGLLRLFNIRGELLRIKEIIAGNSPDIDYARNSLNGIYYYTLTVNDKIIASYKFAIIQ